MSHRIIVSVPLFVAAIVLLQVNFDIIWRYFAWSNQTLATLTLWAITVYLVKEKKFYWLTLLPALCMTMVTSTYIALAPEMLALSANIGYIIGAACTVVAWAVFLRWQRKEVKRFCIV